MRYVENNLLPEERIIAKAKVHWAIFIYPVLLFLLGLFFASLIHLEPPEGLTFSTSTIITSIICIWFLPAVGLFTIIAAILLYITTEFALTDKRVIARVGILNQHSLEVMINKIESIEVNQPILGRILDYGTIIVIGSGGTRQSFRNIAQPMKIRQKINLQIVNSKK